MDTGGGEEVITFLKVHVEHLRRTPTEPEVKLYLPLYHLSQILVTYHHDMASIPLGEVSRESFLISTKRESAKSVWTKQLTRLPCFVVCDKFHFFVYLRMLKSRIYFEILTFTCALATGDHTLRYQLAIRQ